MLEAKINLGLVENESNNCCWKKQKALASNQEEASNPCSTTNSEKSSSMNLNKKHKKNQVEGKWTKAEADNFQLGLEAFGECWPAIQTFVATRSALQIRSHAQKYFRTLKNNAIKKQQKKNKGKPQPFVVIPGFRKKLKKNKYTPIQKIALQTLIKKKFLSKKQWEDIYPAKNMNINEDFGLPPLGSIDEFTRQELDAGVQDYNFPTHIPIMELNSIQEYSLFYQNEEMFPKADILGAWETSDLANLF